MRKEMIITVPGTSRLIGLGARHCKSRTYLNRDNSMAFSDSREKGFYPKCQAPVLSLAHPVG
jgi:hypothetical protein